MASRLRLRRGELRGLEDDRLLLERLLGARTETQADTERLCRVCERRACRRCPVARAAKEKREGRA